MSVHRASSSSILNAFPAINEATRKETGSGTHITPGRHTVLSIDTIPTVIDPENQEMKVVMDWVDEIKFRRPKKHLHRDFSDAVMMAELVSHFLPKLIEVHNYVPASSLPAKRNNWKTINRKVFSKLEFSCSDALIEFIITNKPGAIEVVLKHMYEKIMSIMENRARLAAELECRKSHGDGEGGHGEGCYREATCKIFGSHMDYIMYDGFKFLNHKTIQDRLSRLESQEKEIKDLRSKIRRLETLVSLKDDRLCALSMELHQSLQKATPVKRRT